MFIGNLFIWNFNFSLLRHHLHSFPFPFSESSQCTVNFTIHKEVASFLKNSVRLQVSMDLLHFTWGTVQTMVAYQWLRFDRRFKPNLHLPFWRIIVDDSSTVNVKNKSYSTLYQLNSWSLCTKTVFFNEWPAMVIEN